MASATAITNAVASDMLDAVSAALDAGSAGACIKVYTGTVGANAETTPAGTLLATLTCSTTSFSATHTDLNPGARMTANSITSDTSADATGEAGCFQAGSSNDGTTQLTPVIVGSAGVAADTPDLTFDDDMIVTGGTVAITAWTIDMPES